MATRLSDDEKVEIWWWVGWGRVVSGDRAPVGSVGCAVRWLVCRAGGFAPLPVKRSELRLSVAEREEISRGLGRGDLRRDRGASRSGTLDRVPRGQGQRRPASLSGGPGRGAGVALRPPRVSKLARMSATGAEVEARLEVRWSPQQIARSLRDDFPDEPEMWVSHETIYQSLFVQGRGRCAKS